MPDVLVRPGVACPVCDAVCHPQLEKNGYRIVRCSNCAFLFVDPMPTEEVIAAYYATAYRGACSDFYPKDRSRRWRAFWRSLRFIPYVYNRDIVDLGCGGGHMLSALCRFARSGSGLFQLSSRNGSSHSFATRPGAVPAWRVFCFSRYSGGITRTVCLCNCSRQKTCIIQTVRASVCNWVPTPALTFSCVGV